MGLEAQARSEAEAARKLVSDGFEEVGILGAGKRGPVEIHQPALRSLRRVAGIAGIEVGPRATFERSDGGKGVILIHRGRRLEVEEVEDVGSNAQLVVGRESIAKPQVTVDAVNPVQTAGGSSGEDQCLGWTISVVRPEVIEGASRS